MDSTVDPCDNFDSFLCGGFKQRYSREEIGYVISENTSPMLNKLRGNTDSLKLMELVLN